MENNQQTAVEWYNSKITKLEFWVETKQISWKEYHIGKDKLIEQAKAMEKEHHRETWLDSRIECRCDVYIGKEKTFDEYYNEIYGTK